MWVFTGIGYFSVIEHRKNRELLLVRSRVKGDLEELKKLFLPNLGEILSTPTGADYPYRALAWRVEFAEAMKKAVEAIDYTNFKSGISRTQGFARHDLYMRVWSIMKSAESTMQKIKEDDAKRALEPKQTSWVSVSSEWDKRDDGRFGGKGGKKPGFKEWMDNRADGGTYQNSLDLDGSRRARNKRLGVTGLSEHMLKHQKEDAEDEREAREARMHVENMIRKQLKGTEHDYDKEFEDQDEINTPPSNWIDSAEQFLQDAAESDLLDPTIDHSDPTEE